MIYSCDKLQKPFLGGSTVCIGNLSPEMLWVISFQIWPLYPLAETWHLPILKKAGESQNVAVLKNILVPGMESLLSIL
jgi:hypothetical protein